MTTPPDDDAGLLDRLDEGEPPRSPEEAAAREPYERLFARIRDLEDVAPPPGWEGRLEAQRAAAWRRRRIATAAGVAAAFGLAAVFVLPCIMPSDGGRLQVAVLAAPEMQRRGNHAVGDVLRVGVRRDQAHASLRIYLGIRLIAQCPGSELCRGDASSLAIDWKLEEPGTYRIVALSSAAEIPPSAGTLEQDTLAARTAGVSRETETVTVGR
jgi:hypothetical protein